MLVVCCELIAVRSNDLHENFAVCYKPIAQLNITRENVMRTIYSIVLIALSCTAAQDDGVHVNIQRPYFYQRMPQRMRESRALQCFRGWKDIVGVLSCCLAATQFYYAYVECSGELNHPDKKDIGLTVTFQIFSSGALLGIGCFWHKEGRENQRTAREQRMQLTLRNFQEMYKKGQVKQALGNTFRGLSCGLFTRFSANLIGGKVGAIIDVIGGAITGVIPLYYWIKDCQTGCSAYHDEDFEPEEAIGR